jgi:hypothetical protein
VRSIVFALAGRVNVMKSVSLVGRSVPQIDVFTLNSFALPGSLFSSDSISHGPMLVPPDDEVVAPLLPDVVGVPLDPEVVVPPDDDVAVVPEEDPDDDDVDEVDELPITS